MTSEINLNAGQASRSVIDILACYEAKSQSGGKYVIIKDAANNEGDGPQFHVAQKVNGIVYGILVFLSLFGLNLNAYTTSSATINQVDLNGHLSTSNTAVSHDFTTRFVETTTRELGSEEAREGLINRLKQAIAGLVRLKDDAKIQTDALQGSLISIKDQHQAKLDSIEADDEDGSIEEGNWDDERTTGSERLAVSLAQKKGFEAAPALNFPSEPSPTQSFSTSSPATFRSIESGIGRDSRASPSAVDSDGEVEWGLNANLPLEQFAATLGKVLPDFDNSPEGKLRSLLNQIND